MKTSQAIIDSLQAVIALRETVDYFFMGLLTAILISFLALSLIKKWKEDEN